MDRPLMDSAAFEMVVGGTDVGRGLIGSGAASAGLPVDCDSRSRSDGRAGRPVICGDPLGRLPCRSSKGVDGAEDESMRESKLGFAVEDTGGVARPRTDSSGDEDVGSSNLRFPANVGSAAFAGRAGRPCGLEGPLLVL